jgi:hypothetical protein
MSTSPKNRTAKVLNGLFIVALFSWPLFAIGAGYWANGYIARTSEPIGWGLMREFGSSKIVGRDRIAVETVAAGLLFGTAIWAVPTGILFGIRFVVQR